VDASNKDRSVDESRRSLGTRPSKNRKGGSSKSAGVEVYTAPGGPHQNLFHYTAGAIKHVDYSSKEVCTLQQVFGSALCVTSSIYLHSSRTWLVYTVH